MGNEDVVVIGGGPAGMAAAIEARKNGIDRVLLIERGSRLGGILPQCIHGGFGLQIFKQELTGPEYAHKYISQMNDMRIAYMLDTMVIDLGRDKVITAVNRQMGVFRLNAKAVVLAMGCRERPRGAIGIPGTRPAGIFTAGTAQRMMNIDGYLPGRKIVILGSGDIGLIMARRFMLEGAEVRMVCEIMPHPGGLARNVAQCLDDYCIPLRLGYTVVEIHGKKRLQGVTVAMIGPDSKPDPDTYEFVECDTLLLSVGLIPENELSRQAGITIDDVTQGPVVDERMQTSLEGVFACGNVVQVHDIVDNVTEEAMIAGAAAARYVKGPELFSPVSLTEQAKRRIAIKAGTGVRYVVPQYVNAGTAGIDEPVRMFFRPSCIIRNAKLDVKAGGSLLKSVRKIKVAPNAMESILLNKRDFEKAAESGSGEITLDIHG